SSQVSNSANVIPSSEYTVILPFGSSALADTAKRPIPNIANTTKNKATTFFFNTVIINTPFIILVPISFSLFTKHSQPPSALHYMRPLVLPLVHILQYFVGIRRICAD